MKAKLPAWITVLVISSCLSCPARAVNWLMLQGTEPADVTHRPFVFIQPAYTYDRSDDISLGPNSGKLAAQAGIAPWFNNRERAHLRRFRAGMRGRFTGALHNEFTDKMNYFVLFEMAPNLITYDPFGKRDRLAAPDHLSLTFNHLPGARIRAGLFKTPGPEESWQGVINIDYIEFTSFVATQVLEIFAHGNTRFSPTGGSNESVGTPVAKGYGFNAARDWGIMLFDEFRYDDWALSYGAMLGRGEDIHRTSVVNDHPETYLYLSAERDLPGGAGPRKHGIKWYAWHQQGERSFASDPRDREFERVRYGVGMRALGHLLGGNHKHRLAIEWMGAEGMIFAGPVGGVKGGDLQFAADRDNQSRGLTLDYAFFINPRWELDVRWDRLNLLNETDGTIWARGDEREFTAITLGVNYHISPRSRLTVNHIQRSVEAPETSHPVVENVVESIGDRWALQLTHFF